MIAVEKTHNQPVGFEVGIDIADLVVDLGGFGNDGALGAPEAGGNFVDEIFLEEGLRFELEAELVKQNFEFGRVLFEAGGIDSDMAGMKAVFEGILGDGGFAAIGFRPGGFLGILPVGGDLFFGDRHSYVLFKSKALL